MTGVWRCTPLWLAGHLPLKGGDYSLRRLRQFRTLRGCAPALKPQISPHKGEMPGRAEVAPRATSQITFSDRRLTVAK
ncbi:MAG: hypothetical protein E5V33_12990 [Mesorhizobium sp.]|nr:MAG: hypothetical protein E5V33_12990 [Mesorhizobium sp.]